MHKLDSVQDDWQLNGIKKDTKKTNEALPIICQVLILVDHIAIAKTERHWKHPVPKEEVSPFYPSMCVYIYIYIYIDTYVNT